MRSHAGVETAPSSLTAPARWMPPTRRATCAWAAQISGHNPRTASKAASLDSASRSAPANAATAAASSA
jgi:hypothetical protein